MNIEIKLLNEDCAIIENINEKFNLVYIDPPFFTQRTHKLHNKDEKVFFEDKWENINEYSSWITDVILNCFDKLTIDGSLYIHNNFKTNSIILNNLPDFIQNKYITTIYWQRSHPHNNISNSWGNIVDTILMFGKTKKVYFNVQYQPLNVQYKENSFKNKDDKGYYALAPITGERSRPGNKFIFNGFNPIYGWRKTYDEIKKMDEENLIHYGKNKPYKKIYLDEVKGVPIQNIWTDIFPITRTEKNKRFYPTQKPVQLLERIIYSSCPQGGSVLDPFCGAGTTAIASINTGVPNKVVLIDKNPKAIEIANNWINKNKTSKYF